MLELKSQILLWSGIGLAIFAGIGLYLNLTTLKIDPKQFTIDESVQSIEEEVKLISQLDDMYLEEEQRSSPENQEKITEEIERLLEEKYSKPGGTVEYLFATAQINDMNLFSQAFTYESFTNALFEHKNPDKMAVTEEIMSRITQDGTLKNVTLVRTRPTLGKDVVNVVVELEYENVDPFRISITVMKPENYEDHDSHGHEIEQYFVHSTPWEIIRNIEKKLK